MSKMTLLETFLRKSKDKKIKIGIGVGPSQEQFRTILNGIVKYLSNNQAEISLFGRESNNQEILNREIGSKTKFDVKFVISNNPEGDMIEFLRDRKLDGVIRGGLSSNEFLKSIKNLLNVQEINRLALLEMVNGYQFFFGPVGIDECNDLDSKIIFLEKSLQLFNTIGITPEISILGGGRKGDIGRNSSVDQIILEADRVVEALKARHPDLAIYHHEILIEKAIAERSNLILAPNGISGNLIYRTLVHLGGGKAYGAIYLGLDKIIIDTSRVGKASEIEGALILATALHS